MKYYIVALFDEETYQVISPIQRNMSKKFRANRNSPMPFVLLTSIEIQIWINYIQLLIKL